MIDKSYLISLFQKSLFYKITLVICIIISAIGFLDIESGPNLFTTLCFTYKNQYTIIVLIILFIANMIYFHNIFLKQSFFILRNNDVKSYYKNSIRYFVMLNNRLFIKHLCFSFIFAIIKSFGHLSLEMYVNYHIPMAIYDGLIIVRLFFMIHLITLLAYFILLWTKERIVPLVCYLLILTYLFFFWVYNVDPISSICHMHLFFGYYLIGFECTSFILECALSTIYVLCLYYLVMFILELIVRKMKNYVA